MSKEEYKPIGYEKFILMAILKSGMISLNELEIVPLFLFQVYGTTCIMVKPIIY